MPRKRNIYSKEIPPNLTIKSFTLNQLKLYTEGWPDHAFDKPVEVIPNVWLSGIGFNDNVPKWCKDNNFTHIINAAGSYVTTCNYKTNPISLNINYMELEIEDRSTVNLSRFFKSIKLFFQHAQDSNGKLLIHCIWGQSRSVSCLIYYLMSSQNISYDEALYLIRKVRPVALPNFGFEAQLRNIKT